MKECCSWNRCRNITCEVCSRRYAGQVAKRIQTVAGKRNVIEIDASLSTLADFWSWRIEVRNLTDYRRRDCRWWREFLMTVWLCHDGRLRGIASLGSLTPAEVLEVLNRRWPTTLWPVESNDLRQEIAAIVHPTMIATIQVRARYQSLKFSIWPKASRTNRQSAPISLPTRRLVEPMPVLV